MIPISFFIPCLKSRAVTTTDDAGRIITTYVTTDILGYMGSGSVIHINISDKWTSKTTCKFFTNDFDLKYGDRITYKNQTYQVLSSFKDAGNRNHHNKAILEKIENVT